MIDYQFSTCDHKSEGANMAISAKVTVTKGTKIWTKGA